MSIWVSQPLSFIQRGTHTLNGSRLPQQFSSNGVVPLGRCWKSSCYNLGYHSPRYKVEG